MGFDGPAGGRQLDLRIMEEKVITVDSLQQKLNNQEPVFILDVRPTDQRLEWKIAGSTHVDAYKTLNAGDETALDSIKVPKDSTVVTVCAAGRTSMLAVNLLARKGIKAYSLDGGMKAWNYAWNKAELFFTGICAAIPPIARAPRWWQVFTTSCVYARMKGTVMATCERSGNTKPERFLNFFMKEKI